MSYVSLSVHELKRSLPEYGSRSDRRRKRDVTFSVGNLLSRGSLSFRSGPFRMAARRCGYASAGLLLSTLMHRIDDQNGAAVMAQKIQTLFVDDLDDSEAEGTVRFGLDGTDYEIDLNAKHAQELRDALARYVAAGRRVRASTRQPARSARKTQPNALNTTEVREWAKAQGIDVKDRGRIPAELVVKFKAATGN